MKILYYIVFVIAPIHHMLAAPHYKSVIKNISAAVFTWVCQIMIMSYYLKFDITQLSMTRDTVLLLFLPLVINLYFMTKTWSASHKGS